MSFPAIILAGGESKRMGQDKASLEINNTPLITHVVNKLKLAGCNEIILQIKSIQQKRKLELLIPNIEITWSFDEFENGDVLEALYCALKTAKSKNWNWAQLMPIDTPYISPILFEKMPLLFDAHIDLIIPSTESSKFSSSNGLEPLLACLKIDPALSKISQSLKNKDRRLAKIFSEMQHSIITPNQWKEWGIYTESFTNLNRPKDCESLHLR